jgi:hypothetical protein
MSTFQGPAGHRGGKGRANLGKEVLALRFEALQRRQILVIRLGGVKGNEVEIREVVAHGIKVLGMRIPGHELAKRNALVAANVLDAKLAALLPHGVG